MGLTGKSMGINTLTNEFLYKDNESDIVVALVGNPNVGKSTIFNALTGMNQHTGNWTGKTVASAFGKYNYNDENFILVDLPGTYSLTPNSKEEEVTRDFIGFYNPMVTVVVVDATCIERNLNLVLQTIEVTSNVILCINLMDEADKKSIKIDTDIIKKELNIPVIAMTARSNNGLNSLKREIYKLSSEQNILPNRVRYQDDIEKSINRIELYLNTIFENQENRWLSIKLLTDSSIYNPIKLYLNYDISDDNTLLKIINEEQIKYEDVNKLVIKRTILES